MNAWLSIEWSAEEPSIVLGGEGDSMKVVTIVAFLLLVVLPAEAGQRRDQSTSPPVICDNDGRCTTHNAASASVVSNQTARRKIYTATAVATASPTAGSETETPAASTKEVATPVVSATEAATTAPVVSTADSASEVTLQSVRRFDFDAAVLYSETLVVPLGLGTLTAETIATTMAATAAGFTEATIEVMKTTTSVATPIPVARPLSAGNKLDGIVMSAKTGARARVGIAYAARFQAYI